MLASQSVSDLATRLLGYGIPVFMMHRFVSDGADNGGHTPDFLRRCLQFLKNNGHTFVSLEEVMIALQRRTPLPDKPVVFTMDDGFIDQATLAAPVFSEFNCPATIFLISGMIDGKLWPWDDKVAYIIKNSTHETIEITIDKDKHSFTLDSEQNIYNAISSIQNIIKTMQGESITESLQIIADAAKVAVPVVAPDDYQPMTWDMARSLENKGISFSPHTVSHRILSKLTEEDAEFEIRCSWRRLKDELSSPVPIFCYPTGRVADFGKREIEFLKRNKFIGAVSTVPTFVNMENTSTEYLYSLPRYGLPDNFNDFIQYCTWIEYAKSKLLNR